MNTIVTRRARCCAGIASTPVETRLTTPLDRVSPMSASRADHSDLAINARIAAHGHADSRNANVTDAEGSRSTGSAEAPMTCAHGR